MFKGKEHFTKANYLGEWGEGGERRGKHGERVARSLWGKIFEQIKG